MALTEALRLLITSDSAQARGDLSKLDRSTTSTMSGFDKLKESFKLGAGIGAGAGAVQGVLQGLERLGSLAFTQLQSAVGAASDLQQATGSVRAVFGGAARDVEKFGKSSADAVGLSTAAYGQQASVLGALLQNLGYTAAQAALTSNELIKTGSDLGATFGRPTKDAVLALGAVLRGEYDTIEKFGVKIKQADIDARVQAQGLDTSTQAAKNNAQAVAALALLQEQAGRSSNAFADKQNTLLGQQQRLNAELENARAELGEALLPAMTELVKVARDLIPVVSSVASGIIGAGEAAKSAAGPVIAFAEAMKSAASLIDIPFVDFGGSDGGANARVIQQLKDLESGVRAGKIALEDLAPAVAFLPPSLRALADKLAGVKPAAETGATGIKSLADQVKALQSEASGLAGSLFGAQKGQTAFFKSLEVGGSSSTDNAKKITRALRSIEDAERSLGDANEALKESQIERFLVGLGATSDQITRSQIAERESTRSLADSKRDLIDAQKRLADIRKGDAAGLLDAEAAYIQAQRDFVDAEKTGDAVELKKAQADLIRTEKQLGDLRDPSRTDEFAQATQDVAAAQDNVLKAELDAAQSRKDLNELILRGRDGSRDLAEANKAVEDAQRRVEDSERALIDANDGLNESTTNLGGAVKTVNERFESGITAADGWLQKLIDNKATPEEFSKAVATIHASLKDVADQAGETGTLDAYLTKISGIYTQLQNINNLPKITATSSANSAENALNRSASTKVSLNLNGREFGEAIVEGLLAYQSANGPVPIKVR